MRWALDSTFRTKEKGCVWLTWELEALGSLAPAPHRQSVVGHVYKPSAWTLRTEESESQVHPQLYGEFEVSLRCIALFLKRKKI